MLIYWFIGFIIISIIIFVCLLYYNSPDTIDHPTMYSKCKIDSQCGGDLVCDCNRCKKRLGGNCSSNSDCELDLICHNWLCSDPKDPKDSNKINPDINDIPKSSNNNKKHVKWNDDENSTHYI